MPFRKSKISWKITDSSVNNHRFYAAAKKLMKSSHTIQKIRKYRPTVLVA